MESGKGEQGFQNKDKSTTVDTTIKGSWWQLTNRHFQIRSSVWGCSSYNE